MKSLLRLGPMKNYSRRTRAFTANGARAFSQKANFKPPLLPSPRQEDEGKLTVVLDMDETLLHSVFEAADYRQDENRQQVSAKKKPCFEVMLHEEGMPDERVRVFTRPGLQRFLAHVSEHFEPILFTAALPIYANPVLDIIEKDDQYLRQRFYRESTVQFGGYPFVKDIRMLGRPIERTVLVDNNPYAMLATLSNGIPIKDFYDDKNDTELDKLIKLLDHLNTLPDVRPYLTSHFRMEDKLVQSSKL